ncbi:MAG: hypothetical protein HQ502_06540 [Alphaproteobacteria bacterium]|nr:hypothetical protein [Alphaproteobacteria bacterium]
MGVKDAKMDIEDVKGLFASWTPGDLSEAGIVFTELVDPPYDPDLDDYWIIYEASFKPDALDKAGIEFCLTEEGYVGVSIEPSKRVTQRLGLWTTTDGDVVGHDLMSVSMDGLKLLFDIVVQGRLFIVVRSVLGLELSAKGFISASDYDTLLRSGYDPRDVGLTSLPPGRHDNGPTPVWGKVLSYRPW